MSNSNFHKITFKMASPVCFIDRPCFDALIVYCWMKDKYGGGVRTELNLAKEKLSFFPGLPIDYHPAGYPVASLMLFDKKEATEDTIRIRKRWCSRYDGLADFGSSKKRVDTGKGHFKSFDLPLRTYDVKDLWFYFQGDKDEVSRLINSYLHGIGKKTSIGFGMFENYRIEEAERKVFADILLRPIPTKYAFFDDRAIVTPYHTRYCGFRPSYYKPENMAKCIYPNL